MNENIDLVEILKDCPFGIKLYSPLMGQVLLDGVHADMKYPISVFKYSSNCHKNQFYSFMKDGRYTSENTECLLFPSKELRDWSLFGKH